MNRRDVRIPRLPNPGAVKFIRLKKSWDRGLISPWYITVGGRLVGGDSTGRRAGLNDSRCARKYCRWCLLALMVLVLLRIKFDSS